MTLRLILLCLLSMTSISSFCQESDWVFAAKDKDGDRWSVKANYISKSDAVIKTWIKIEFRKDVITKNGKKITVTNGKRLNLIEADCDEGKMKLIAIYVYNSTGNLVSSRKIEDYDQEWTDIVPETIGESVFNKICELFR